MILVYILCKLYLPLYMEIVSLKTGESHRIEIIPLKADDYKSLSKSRFWFNWGEERTFDVFKLRITGRRDILGLISLQMHPRESRVEIRLFAVSREYRGRNKKYDHVAGNLIAFACKRALTLYGEWACISLLPKTLLINHYESKYGLTRAGRSLIAEGRELIELLRSYDHD